MARNGNKRWVCKLVYTLGNGKLEKNILSFFQKYNYWEMVYFDRKRKLKESVYLVYYEKKHAKYQYIILQLFCTLEISASF